MFDQLHLDQLWLDVERFVRFFVLAFVSASKWAGLSSVHQSGFSIDPIVSVCLFCCQSKLIDTHEAKVETVG